MPAFSRFARLRFHLPSSGYARRAFTLIELLTVIAIIGILAAIIIPTVGKVRETARSSQCISNQRQIAMAFGLYAGDHKGFLPRSGIPESWTLSVADYLPSKGKVVTNKIFVCPVAPQAPDDYASSVFSYTASFALEKGNAATKADGEDGNGPRLLNSIVNPSRTLLLVDGVVNATTYKANSSRGYTLVSTDLGRAGPDADGFEALHFRHGGSLAVAYVDGHAEKVQWAKRFEVIPDISAWNGKQPQS